MTTAYSVRWSKTIALRRLMLLLSILLITTVIWFISAELFNQDAVGSDTEMKIVVVEKGDTLWSIAKEEGGNGDIRRIIYQIKLINKLSSAQIYPGQELNIPAG